CLSAVSMAGKNRCGQDGPVEIAVARERRIYVEPNHPSAPTIVAGNVGTLTVRLSCPDPDDGATVVLQSSDPATLRLPPAVQVFPGETSAPVQFATDRAHFGQVRIVATLAGHRDGELAYDVVEFLTAIVLSGGGAKGSFEAGALLYLRE